MLTCSDTDHRRSRSPPPSRYDSSHSNNRAPVPPRSDAGSARSRDDNDRVPAPRDAPREERNGKGNAKDKRERSPSPVTADDAADVDAAAMAAMMGFSGFDTTSVSVGSRLRVARQRSRTEHRADLLLPLRQHKHVQDDLAAVAIKQPRTHRQYMNRCVQAGLGAEPFADSLLHALTCAVTGREDSTGRS